MKRMIIHWTGGSNRASNVDRKAYHFIIEGDGTVVDGNLKPEANLNISSGDYAAHTRRLNTGSIGIGVAAMMDATERPFSTGSAPITEEQVTALVELCANLAETYNIPVTRRTVLTHAEVQPTLGVAQRAKWDIMWLPGLDGPQDPLVIGDQLRRRINAAVTAPVTQPAPTLPVQAVQPDVIAPQDGLTGEVHATRATSMWSGGIGLALTVFVSLNLITADEGQILEEQTEMLLASCAAIITTFIQIKERFFAKKKLKL